MIIPSNFNVLRSKSVDLLPETKRFDSFDYHIDVQSQWEFTYSNLELLFYLGIHQTHESRFSELCYDLTGLDKRSFRKQAKFHKEIVEATAKLISTNIYDYPNVKYDLGELFIDWHCLSKINDEISNVVDYGAGCGRQVIGLMHNCKNFRKLYAIDASTNGYTVQNFMYSACSVLGHINFVDLLDFEQNNQLDRGISLAGNSHTNKPTVIHMPAWLDHSLMQDGEIDLLMACHVHNELSKSDFLRLINIADKKVRDGGYVYIRSELGIWGDTLYEDSVHFHALDPVETLAKCGFIVHDCKYIGGFQTTIFKRASKQKESAFRLNKIFFKDRKIESLNNFKDCSFYAAENFNLEMIHRLIKDFEKVVYIDGTYKELDQKVPTEVKQKLVIIKIDEINKDIIEGNPIIISDHGFGEIEKRIGEEELAKRTRLQYTFPMVHLIPKRFDLDYETLQVKSF